MLSRNGRTELIAVMDELANCFNIMGWSLAECQAVVEVLSGMDSTLKANLTDDEYQPLAEVNNGLIGVIAGTDWEKLTASERTECSALCREIAMSERAIIATMPTKKIMVFLPYKASMWDSLESVWQAAVRDAEHTEAYVIPIAYADRNPDRSIREWHCEVGDFPQYVPVKSWVDYTIERLAAIHPDVIFIHNPYDANNFITSIDGQYYSDRLKPVCDTLIYIPYFVSDKTVGKVGVMNCGVKNADYVIVQDDNLREQYEAMYPGGSPPVGKILALGSPKFDRALMARRENYQLPATWNAIISGRKVVLYITTLIDVMSHPANVCAKLRAVLRYFRDNKDYALWWRPHPLMEATFSSLLPVYAEEYKAIVAEYRQQGWGIYDDKGDLDCAIACTDVYYGDHSSVAQLYEVTGKNIVYQTLTQLATDEHGADVETAAIDWARQCREVRPPQGEPDCGERVYQLALTARARIEE